MKIAISEGRHLPSECLVQSEACGILLPARLSRDLHSEVLHRAFQQFQRDDLSVFRHSGQDQIVACTALLYPITAVYSNRWGDLPGILRSQGNALTLQAEDGPKGPQFQKPE